MQNYQSFMNEFETDLDLAQLIDSTIFHSSSKPEIANALQTMSVVSHRYSQINQKERINTKLVNLKAMSSSLSCLFRKQLFDYN
jgi:hypothetical protein